MPFHNWNASMKSFFILTVFLFLLNKSNCIAQQFNVKTYSFAEGLKTYNIKKAVQDKYGFIWLATQDGVYRYDGTTFEPYKKSEDANTSIRGNFIFDITLGNDENLYIASFTLCRSHGWDLHLLIYYSFSRQLKSGEFSFIQK